MTRLIPKKYFDAIMVLGAILFQLLWYIAHPSQEPIVRISHAFGVLAFLYLSLVLLIGPAGKLWPWATRLVYNRRHFGVFTFFLALCHGLLQDYLTFNFNVLALVGQWSDYRHAASFPFATLGLFALIVLMAMAATSWDWAVKLLHFTRWKLLHMCVYLAYTALIFHIWLGALAYTDWPVLKYLFDLLVGLVVLTHLGAALKVRSQQRKIRENTWNSTTKP